MPNFIKVGNAFINLSRVEMVRDYPDAKEALIIFAGRQASELLGGPERLALMKALEEQLFASS